MSDSNAILVGSVEPGAVPPVATRGSRGHTRRAHCRHRAVSGKKMERIQPFAHKILHAETMQIEESWPPGKHPDYRIGCKWRKGEGSVRAGRSCPCDPGPTPKMETDASGHPQFSCQLSSA